MTDHWANYSNHADSGIYTTGIQIETNDEELYRKNRQVLLGLIDEIEKAEIHPDTKLRIVNGIKAASENPVIAYLIITYLASHIHL